MFLILMILSWKKWHTPCRFVACHRWSVILCKGFNNHAGVAPLWGLLDYPLMSIELFYESDHVVTPWFGLGRFVGITQRDAVEQLVALGESQTVEIRLG